MNLRFRPPAPGVDAADGRPSQGARVFRTCRRAPEPETIGESSMLEARAVQPGTDTDIQLGAEEAEALATSELRRYCEGVLDKRRLAEVVTATCTGVHDGMSRPDVLELIVLTLRARCDRDPAYSR